MLDVSDAAAAGASEDDYEEELDDEEFDEADVMDSRFESLVSLVPLGGGSAGRRVSSDRTRLPKASQSCVVSPKGGQRSCMSAKYSQSQNMSAKAGRS